MTINLFGHLFEELLGNSIGQLIEPVFRDRHQLDVHLWFLILLYEVTYFVVNEYVLKISHVSLHVCICPLKCNLAWFERV